MISVIDKYNFDFLYTCGYSKAISQMKVTEINELIKTLWLHYVKYSPQSELCQLRQSLCETLSFDTFMSMHPDSAWALLASSNSFDVTSAYLLDAFVIQYSDNGSNNRLKTGSYCVLLV